MNGGVALCVEVDPARIERRIKTRYLDRETDDLDEALRWVDEARSAREAVSIGLVGNCARSSGPAHARVRARSRHRPDERARPARRLPADGAVARRRREAARGGPRGIPTTLLRLDGSARRGDGGVPRCRRDRVRLRQQPPRGRGGRWDHARARLRVSGVRAGVRPADVLRGQGAVPLGGAVGRPGGHLEDRSRGRRAVPRERAGASVARHGRGACRVPGPAGAHLLARVRGTRSRGSAVQRDGRERRALGADRDRPRPPGQRERREPVPGDRGDEGRLGRDRRLADPERAREHRGRRALGECSPRRRRGDRLLDPRGDGRRCRRERQRRGPARASADDRSRDRRHASRGRGLRGSHRGRGRSGVRLPWRE